VYEQGVRFTTFVLQETKHEGQLQTEDEAHRVQSVTVQFTLTSEKCIQTKQKS
jgi:hypothetical protein